MSDAMSLIVFCGDRFYLDSLRSQGPLRDRQDDARAAVAKSERWDDMKDAHWIERGTLFRLLNGEWKMHARRGRKGSPCATH